MILGQLNSVVLSVDFNVIVPYEQDTGGCLTVLFRVQPWMYNNYIVIYVFILNMLYGRYMKQHFHLVKDYQ